MSAGRAVEELLPEVTADRLDTYEALLAALAGEQVRLPLWEGAVGEPGARYGDLEVAGHHYAPAFTSSEELAASGWPRQAVAVAVRDLAVAFYREHRGLWLNPHARGGGVGVPWPDLRRVAHGLSRLPAGPLRIGAPGIAADDFYQQLVAEARRTPPLRTLRRAWVQPAVGTPYLALGLEVDESDETVVAVRRMMHRTVATVPEGLVVGTVAMDDQHDPVVLWLWANARPFYERGASAAAGGSAVRPAPAQPPGVPGAAPGVPHGYGYPGSG